MNDHRNLRSSALSAVLNYSGPAARSAGSGRSTLLRIRAEPRGPEPVEGLTPRATLSVGGEGADRGAGGGEAVAPGGREMARQAEGFERIGIAGDYLRGSGAAEKIAEQSDQTADDGRFRFGLEVAPAIAQFADEPHDGDATVDAVGVDAVGRRERRALPCPIDGQGKAFIRIENHREVLDQLLLLFGEGHRAVRASAGSEPGAVGRGWNMPHDNHLPRRGKRFDDRAGRPALDPAVTFRAWERRGCSRTLAVDGHKEAREPKAAPYTLRAPVGAPKISAPPVTFVPF